MRHIVVGIFVFAAGCSRPVSPTAPSGALDLGLVSAQATAATDNLVVPFEAVIFVPCANDGAGEDVVLSGRLHVLIHSTTNANVTTLKFHAQPQGVSGRGVVTGDQYRATGVTQSNEIYSEPGADAVVTFVNNFRIIGSGPGNNLLVHEVFHFTVNANGELTAFVAKFSADCR